MTTTAKKPAVNEEPTTPVIEAEPTVGRADRIVNAQGQTVVADGLPDAVDVTIEQVTAYGDSRSITVVLDGNAYKLDTQASAYLSSAVRSLVTNLNL